MFYSGSFQRRESEPRVPEGVDPDDARHQGAAVLGPPGDRPPLEVGHRQEGSRGQKENVKTKTKTKTKTKKRKPNKKKNFSSL